MEKYVCKECGKEVQVKQNGTIVRSCEHKGTVILQIAIVVTGEGKMDGGQTQKSH